MAIRVTELLATLAVVGLAGPLSSDAQTAPAAPSLPPPASAASARTADQEPARNVQPLPDTGFLQTFSYSRSDKFPGVYEIRPVGDPEPSLVSENYLRMIINNGQLSDDMKLTAAMAYPVMALKWYDMVMPKHYPDASSPAPTEAFSRRTLSAPDGTRVTLDQDSLAFPYVRVSIVHPDGKTEEFSMQRQLVEQLLNDKNFTDEQRVDALPKYPFRLPDQARYDFKRLSAAELYELAAQGETVQKEDLIRMRNIFEAQIRTQAEASARTNQVADVRREYVEKIKKQWAPKSPSAPGPGAMTRPVPVNPERRTGPGRSDVNPSAATTPAATSTPRSSALSMVAVALVAVVAAGIAFYLGRRSR